jgi:GT2 family glycosyltransferase
MAIFIRLDKFECMKKKISVIVINWNSGILTIKALQPFLKNSSNSFDCQIIVVDNCSSDDSIQLLQQCPIKLIANSVNRGFGRACNQAMEVAKGDYVLLLNPDTVSELEVLEHLFNFLEKQPAYGVAGPKQITDDGTIIRSCGRFPIFSTSLYEVLSLSKIWPQHFSPVPIMREWDHRHSRDVDHIMGSYMLIRRTAIDKAGFMDDDYFVYYEDIDLSRRLYKEGYKSYFMSDCTIYHKGGASGGAETALRLYYSLSARNIYWYKHLENWQAFILTLLSFTIEPFLRAVLILLKGRLSEISNLIKAHFWYYKKAVLKQNV